MQIVRDEPGRVVHLEHVGGRLTRRHGKILLILALLWGAPIAFSMAIPRRDLFKNPWGAGCMLAGWCAFSALMTLALTKGARHAQRLLVDRSKGTWSLAERRLWAVGEVSDEIPVSSIERFVVRTVRNFWGLVPGAIPFEIELLPSNRKLALELEWVDRFEEVLDLAFRLGAASGLTHYRVVRNTLTEFEVEVSHDLGRMTLPIPRIDTPSDYEQEVSSAEGAVARPATGPFRPEGWTGKFRVEAWKPGHLVSFHAPGHYGALGCLTLFLSPFLLAGLMPLWEGITVPKASSLGFAALWYSILALFFASVGSGCRGSTAQVDWKQGTLWASWILGKRMARLEEVKRIEVVGRRGQRSEGEDGPTYDVYSCQVLAVCSDASGTTHRIRLTQTDDAREDPDTPYRAAWPLAEALAEALKVPARYKDYR